MYNKWSKLWWIRNIVFYLRVTEHIAHAVFQEHIAPLRGDTNAEHLAISIIQDSPNCPMIRRNLIASSRGI